MFFEVCFHLVPLKLLLLLNCALEIFLCTLNCITLAEQIVQSRHLERLNGLYFSCSW